MIKYIKGDLFLAPEDILAHGCNCVGGYGSGVAYGMSVNHAKAKHAYLDKYDDEGWKLGDVQFIRSKDKWIANCGTQKEYYPRNKCHADYDAIRTCMEKVRDFAIKNNLSVACPKIGAGLAGGNWLVIQQIIEEVFENYEITVYTI